MGIALHYGEFHGVKSKETESRRQKSEIRSLNSECLKPRT
jgi:hypothetical protein